MGMPVIIRRPSLPIFLWLAFFSLQATAAIDNADLLDKVLERYSKAATTWGAIATTRASWLFWTLVVISMIFTFGFMALRKADIGEFYAEFVRFTIFTGFFWWVLVNGPRFATTIMTSLRMIGAEASGLANVLAPSGIVDIGFDIFWKVLDQSTVWAPIDSACGMLLGGAVLVMFTIVGVNMLLLLVSGWILAYAGVFFLGFGGSRWTSDMAITYYKSVLNIAAQLMTMILLVGIGKSIVDQYYAAMSAGMNLKELSVMMIVSLVLLLLVKTVPGLIGALASGNVGSLGSGFGVGAMIGAAAMAGAAAATAGAAVAAGATGMAGGIQALMSAYSKASTAENAGGGASSLLSATGGGSAANDASGGSLLAAAMGDPGAGSSGSSDGASSSASSGDLGGAGNGAQGADRSTGTGSTSGAEQAAEASGSNKDGPTDEAKRGGLGAKAAHAGKIAAGTAGNLAVGSWDVAKAKASDLRQSAMDRIGDTTGGKIAAAINARAADGKAPKFGDDSLSAAADDKTVDAESEVAAFRDRDSKAS
jgi:type IV secretion system protein VirB6/type IV secretion system protein TrbL